MKFFLPLTADERQAERIYQRIIKRLRSLACKVSHNRIYKVTYKLDGKQICDFIGSTAENGEVIIAIFSNDVGYFICTYSRGVIWGEPIIARYPIVESVEYFDPEV